MTYVLSPRAAVDLDEIWDYTAATWGEAQAERYIRDIWRAIATVAAEPRKGRTCDDIRVGYSKFAVGSHVLFYRRTDAGIDVVRILHNRMDCGRHL